MREVCLYRFLLPAHQENYALQPQTWAEACSNTYVYLWNEAAVRFGG